MQLPARESEIIRQHWRRAARKLDFRVDVPFEVVTPERTLLCDAHLPHFGGKQGTVVCCRFDLSAHPNSFPGFFEIAKSRGLFPSMMRVSEQFDLEEFRDALIDWGFWGPAADRPRWLTIDS